MTQAKRLLANLSRTSAVPLLVLLLALATAASAQQDRGTFTGIVTDPSGAAVPNVRITVRNMATNALYHSRTNELGQYTVPALPIGVYSLTFEADGFKTAVREGLRLQIGQVARVDVSMELGATMESITVTAATPLLQTDAPDVGLSLDNTRVIDLPLSFSGGRYPEDFAYKLTPGVEGNNWTSRINGSPAFTKEVLLDGASATIYITGHFGESSVSMEALEEFKVQTSGMNAEHGRTAGGVFNFVMKSGTNDWHGTGMYQFRNEWMNANSFANNFYGRPRPRDRRHNWALSGGGPVTLPKIYNGKDKSFFYVAWEKYKDANRGTGTPSVTVPTLPWYEGDMSNYLTGELLGRDALGRPVYRGQIYDPASVRTLPDGSVVRDPFVGNIIPKSRMSRVSQKVAEIMKKHYAPAIPDALINNAFFPTFNTAKFEQKQFSIKGDHYFSAQHKMSGSYAWIDRPRTLLDQGGVWDFNDPEKGGPLSRARLQKVETFMARLSYDWTISPTLLNHFGAAFNRQLNPSTSWHVDEPGGEILGLKGINGKSNYPQINWGGGDRVNLATIGYLANDKLIGTTYQILDTVSWMKGRHAFKFGGDIKKLTLADTGNPGPGTFNFSADHTGLPGFARTGHPFASFFLGEVASASVPILTPTTSQMYSIGLFILDDIKVTPKLTLNLGLRWDGQPAQTEWHDRLHNFNPALRDPLTGLPGAVEFAGTGPGRSGKRKFVEDQWNDFGPRAGLAYQVTNKIVFRSAYGIFYLARVPNEWSGVPYGNKYGFTQTNQVPSRGIYPAFNWDNGYPGTVQAAKLDPSNSDGSQWNLTTWDPEGGKVAYTQQWNANLQFELPGQMVVDVGYIGTTSIGLPFNQARQINQVHPRFLALRDDLGKWVNSQAAIPESARALGAIYPYERIPEGQRPGGGWVPVWQTLAPFPQVLSWNVLQSYYTPLGFSTYNALQIQFNKRYSHGLSWLANYTFSKSIDNLENAFNSWVNAGRPMDYYNLKLEKTISPYDQTHIVKIGVTYELPVGKGRLFLTSMHPALEFLAGGWTLQYLGNYRSGMPLGFAGTSIPNFNAATNRALIINPQGQSLMVDFNPAAFDMGSITRVNPSHKIINTSIIRDPADIDRYMYGNASFRMSGARGFPLYQDDFGLQKNWRLKERVRFQFRWELLNAFNRHRFSTIETNPARPLFGQVIGVDGGFYRTMQMGARFEF